MKAKFALSFVALAGIGAAVWGLYPVAAHAQSSRPNEPTPTGFGPLQLKSGDGFKISYVLTVPLRRLASPHTFRMLDSEGRVVYSEEIIVAAHPGGQPHVKVFSGRHVDAVAGGLGEHIELFSWSDARSGPTDPPIRIPTQNRILIGMLLPAIQKVRGNPDQPMYPLAASVQTFDGVDYGHTDLYMNIGINQD